MPSSHTRDSTHLSVYTRADSIREYVSDSMSIRFGKVSSAGGNGIPDTVYIDRWHTAYRDRWHTLNHTAYRDRWHAQNHTDTIRVTRRDSIPYPVEVPKYIRQRNLYDRATSCGFWLLLTIFIIYVFVRIGLK